MSMSGFNTGRDITLNIVGYLGSIASFALLTGFQRRQETVSIKIKGIDGQVRHLEIPDGWTGTLSFEKQDDSIDSYFAGLEAAYYGGSDIQAATITETIQNPDGSVAQYRYTNVQLKIDDAGDWQGDQTVKMRLGWAASQRIKVQ